MQNNQAGKPVGLPSFYILPETSKKRHIPTLDKVAYAVLYFYSQVSIHAFLPHSPSVENEGPSTVESSQMRDANRYEAKVQSKE